MTSKLARLIKRQRDSTQQVRDEVEETRARIEKLTKERQAARSAPVTLEVAVASMHAAIEAAQSDTAILGGLARFMAPDGGAILDTDETRLAYARQPLTFLAAVAPEAVRVELERKLTAAYDEMPGPTYSAEDRRSRLLEINREVAQLERDEEYAIRTAERIGVGIERRADATPSVVLLPDEALRLDAATHGDENLKERA